MSLSTNELSWMRDSLEELMPDVCNILTLTRTSDSQGGWSESWGTATANVKCRLDQRYGREQTAGGEIQPFSYWQLTLPHGTTITTEQRVEISSNTFNVQSVDTGKSWSACVRATLGKV